jgi:hypothetical protein
MPFKKGKPKTGGVQKGGTHTKKAVREIVEAALGGKTIPEEMLTLAGANPKLRLQVLEGLLPYSYPKLQAIEHSGEIGNPASEEVKELVEWLKKTREIT